MGTQMGLLTNKPTGQEVRLGHKSRPYFLVAEEDRANTTKYLHNVWGVAKRANVVWPPVADDTGQTVSKILQCLQAMLEFVEEARSGSCWVRLSPRHNVGLNGGGSRKRERPENASSSSGMQKKKRGGGGGGAQRDAEDGEQAKESYSVSHCVRGVAWFLETLHPQAFSSMTMRQLKAFVPDEHDHTSALDDMTYQEVQRRFGFSPLLVSCWACMLNFIGKPGMGKLLSMDSYKIMTKLSHSGSEW